MLKYISKFTRYAPIAQLDRVSGYEPEGRGFESCLAHHISQIRLWWAKFSKTRKCEARAPVAQLDRVSGYEPEGRGFESLLACQFTLVTLLGILYTSVLKAVNKIIYHTAEQVQLLHCDNIHFVFRLIVSINALASLRSLTPTQSDVAQLYQ